MRKITILFFLILTINGYSQEKPKLSEQFYIGTSLGANVPIGDFKSSEYLKNGICLNIDAGYLFTRKIGVCFKYTSYSNNIDANSLATYILYSDPSFTSASVQSNPFTIKNFDFGIVSNSYIGSVIFQYKLFAGISSSQIAQNNCSITVGTTPVNMIISSASSMNFNYGIDLSVKCLLTKKLSLNINLGTLSTTGNFLRTVTVAGSDITQFGSSSYDINYINYGIGLTYQIMK